MNRIKIIWLNEVKIMKPHELSVQKETENFSVKKYFRKSLFNSMSQILFAAKLSNLNPNYPKNLSLKPSRQMTLRSFSFLQSNNFYFHIIHINFSILF